MYSSIFFKNNETLVLCKVPAAAVIKTSVKREKKWMFLHLQREQQTSPALDLAFAWFGPFRENQWGKIGTSRFSLALLLPKKTKKKDILGMCHFNDLSF